MKEEKYKDIEIIGLKNGKQISFEELKEYLQHLLKEALLENIVKNKS